MVHLAATIHSLVPLQEVGCGGTAYVELEEAEHGHLHREDILLRVRLVGDKYEVPDFRRVDFFELGSDEHGCDTDELQPLPRNCLLLQEPVDYVDGEEQRFGFQL